MHALSASGLRSGHMSPPAMVLAVLLHALAALALWAMAKYPPRLPPAQDPVEIVFERPPKPPPKPPQPQPKVAAKPEPPVHSMLGVPPPAAITADKPSQAAPKAEKSSPGKTVEAMTPEPPSLEQALPRPPEPQPAPPETAFAAPQPAPPQQNPGPRLPAPAKPTPPAPQLRINPSPLSRSPLNRPPTSANAEEPPASTFVNPADVYNRARVADNYRWQIVRKLSSYVYYARVPVSTAVTVVRVVIARDGRVLDVGVAQSSGYPALDQGTVAGVRSGSPYAPLPPEIKGESATFMLPLMSLPVKR